MFGAGSLRSHVSVKCAKLNDKLQNYLKHFPLFSRWIPYSG